MLLEIEGDAFRFLKSDCTLITDSAEVKLFSSTSPLIVQNARHPPQADVDNVYSDSMMGNRQNFQPDKTDYMLVENVSPCVVRHCNRLTRKAVNSPLLKILKTRESPK